jgi:small-conductance mechanosensitive channel
MNARPFLSILLFFALLGLAACVPVPEVTVEEAPEVSASSSATATVSPGNKLDQPSPEGDTQPAESESPPEGDQFLIVPTLAPTATPGVIYAVVEHVVEVANLNETQFWGLSAADWINLGISLFLVWLTFILLSRLIFAVLKIIALRTPTPYDEIYLDSIRHYLRWLLGMIILYIAIARLQFLSPQLKQWLGQIVAVVIIWLVIMCLWKLVDIFSLWYHDKVKDQDERSSKDAALLLADRAVRTLLVLVGLIYVLDYLGFNISALLTAIGIGGLAISLAAQDTIANMISGVIILTDQPFRTGDRIEIQELNTWGDVVSIGLRSTRIRTLDNRLVVVPNSRISNNQVVNYTFPDPQYRIQTGSAWLMDPICAWSAR